MLKATEKLIYLLARRSEALSRESIFFRVTFRGHHPFDDGVHFLKSHPLGMFIYNLRIIFLSCGFVYLVAFLGLIISTHDPRKFYRQFLVLLAAWTISTFATFALHRNFMIKLKDWAGSLSQKNFPRLFDSYFFVDFMALLLIVTAGIVLHLGLEGFAFLLFANSVVYAAHARRAKQENRNERLIRLGFYLQLVVSVLLLPFTNRAASVNAWVFLYLLPIWGMFFVTAWSVMMISWLRSDEHEVIERRLTLLGDFERLLSSEVGEGATIGNGSPDELLYRRLGAMLNRLCNLQEPFWYKSAMIWFRETHQDINTEAASGVQTPPSVARPVFVDGPCFPVNLSVLKSLPAEVTLKQAGLMAFEHQVIVQSAKYQADLIKTITPGVDTTFDAPAAFVPLKHTREIGTLAIYGRDGGAPPQLQDSSFLSSCGSILSSAIERWEAWYGEAALQEMDELFKFDNLHSLGDEAARLMQKYLAAQGCMILYRPNPQDSVMSIIGKKGFSDAILEHNVYDVSKGQTGLCARLGSPIRWDDVPTNRHQFDEDLLTGMEAALEAQVNSWMAIPIGSLDHNYGVIKVVNRQFARDWFSEQDQQLALALALRLQVIIQQFQHTERHNEQMKRAMDDAQARSEEAKRQAEQRQEDLMVTMHQLQGPLYSMLGSISYLQKKFRTKDPLKQLPRDVKKDVEEELTKLDDFVEDSKALSYGTFTSFAMDAGRDASFEVHKIDAPEELKKLASRLQRTNDRPDLNFIFYAEDNFPVLKMDRNVFTSVVYSLIHNAMKYADRHSQVTLVCALDRRTNEPVLKVNSVGEPIHRAEQDEIFKKFSRGRVVSIGRRHSGVGLGLWVAKKLMKRFGGDLTVEFSAKNARFSGFVVHMPQSTIASGE